MTTGAPSSLPTERQPVTTIDDHQPDPSLGEPPEDLDETSTSTPMRSTGTSTTPDSSVSSIPPPRQPHRVSTARLVPAGGSGTSPTPSRATSNQPPPPSCAAPTTGPGLRPLHRLHPQRIRSRKSLLAQEATRQHLDDGLHVVCVATSRTPTRPHHRTAPQPWRPRPGHRRPVPLPQPRRGARADHDRRTPRRHRRSWPSPPRYRLGGRIARPDGPVRGQGPRGRRLETVPAPPLRTRGRAVLLLDHSTKAGDNPLFPSGSKRERALICGGAGSSRSSPRSRAPSGRAEADLRQGPPRRLRQQGSRRLGPRRPHRRPPPGRPRAAPRTASRPQRR